MPKLSKKALIKFIKKASLVWLGLISIMTGVACSIIPFVPGFIFVFIGLALISRGSETVHNLKITKATLKEFKKRISKMKIPHIHKFLSLL